MKAHPGPSTPWQEFLKRHAGERMSLESLSALWKQLSPAEQETFRPQARGNAHDDLEPLEICMPCEATPLGLGTRSSPLSAAHMEEVIPRPGPSARAVPCTLGHVRALCHVRWARSRTLPERGVWVCARAMLGRLRVHIEARCSL